MRTRNKEKAELKNTWVAGICTIIAALIGIFSVNINIKNNKLKRENEEVVSENTDLVIQTNESQEAYDSLYSQYENLVTLNNDLQVRVSSLEDELSHYSNIIKENTVLNNKVKELQEEIDRLSKASALPTSSPKTLSEKKISIFDLDTFQGKAYWFKDTTFPFSDEDDWLIDMYGNEFHTGYIAFHGEENGTVDAIYNLDNKYSQCNIKIAWPRGAKNLVGAGAYIKFYSDNQLIATSPEIKCGDEPIEFTVDITGVKKFSFERIATGNGNPWMSVTIIYCYFDLIENNA